jgi:hypothetical protein
MKSNFRAFLAATSFCLALLAPTSASAGYFLDATDPGNGVTLSLTAGSYLVSYDSGAWNAWSSVSGCDASHHCATGWLNQFSIVPTIDAASFFADGVVWETAALAEANGKAMSPLTLTLSADQMVKIYIGDFPYYDNQGGITVSIAAVPEPETYAMLLAGLGLLGFAARRKQHQTV